MLLTYLLSLLAPHECLGCFREGAVICRRCSDALPVAMSCCYRCHRATVSGATCRRCQLATPLKSTIAATKYDGVVKDVLWKLKSGRASAAAAEIGAVMALRYSRRNFSGFIVTNVPTANRRVRQRGYDQAALIAKAFAAKTSLPYSPLLARRGVHQQVGADKYTRAHQLTGDFEAIRQKRIAGARILLIDDVITTGATLEACARELVAAGADRVDAVVFAQA